MEGGNTKHYAGTGTCSAKPAPERNGYYFESKTGLHLVCLLHRAAEIVAMWSNDKYVDQPEMTFNELCRIEEQLRRERLLSQQQEQYRESRAMLGEDWVMIEKIFLKVQLYPGGMGMDLEKSHIWLKALYTR